jgi:long-subunit acyl-CoA synthetase (AMP-forming)
MANGEKTVPGVIEGAICAHPLVQGAVAFGRGREQIGVLVEPNMAALQCMTLDQIKDEIWCVRLSHSNFHTLTPMIRPSVEGGNAQMPAFSRVFKEMILMTSYDKPLPRADKVTVNRKGALMKYADEINALCVISFRNLVMNLDAYL